MPRNGFLVSRHHLQASIFPSIPRLPKPPGTTTPLKTEKWTGLNKHALKAAQRQLLTFTTLSYSFSTATMIRESASMLCYT
jgi:hypothetical protein